MEYDFWHSRWVSNEIGFHQQSETPQLIQYWSDMAPDNASVFLPLCGKSLDILWLKSRGHHVIGVEFSTIAVESFFSENNIPYDIEKKGTFSVYTAPNITIYQGDFFDLNADDLKGVQYVFDRAALIALPADMRLRYATKINDLIDSNTKILLVALEYDQALMAGPPFSVSDDEINKLYVDSFSVEILHQENIIDDLPRFKQRGLNALDERCYKLVKI